MTPPPDYAIITSEIAGATIAAVPAMGLFTWIVGRFAFKRRRPTERARLVTFSTYAGFSALWLLAGNGYLVIQTAPAIFIIWGIYHWWAKRRTTSIPRPQLD